MGRQAAGESFLKAWTRYAEADPLTCWTANRRHADQFERQVRGMGAMEPIAAASIDTLDPLVRAGALWLADPNLGDHAWLRSRAGALERWSIVGVTHTTASHSVMDMIADLPIAPTQPWDALICTSRSVRATVEEVLRRQTDHLRQRLGAQRFDQPQLPIIPLGVHPEDFEQNPDNRHRWREHLGIAQGDVAVLQMGRLSFHAKAHPLPLFLALEAAAARSRIRPHLILAGWFANEGQERLFRETARQYAPSVHLHVVDGRAAGVRRTIWSAADIFTLLADNVQETFGLAPVEAMAAGLPVVVSDWDGFKDTVVHGVHGFRIRTRQPETGAGDIIATRYEVGLDNYDLYVGASSQAIAVDVPEAAEAFRLLFEDGDRRARMGVAGRAHAHSNLSWRRIIGLYQALLRDLEDRRRGAAVQGTRARPSRLDPFVAFRSYPSAVLDGATEVSAASPEVVERLPGIHACSGASTFADLLPTLSEMAAILNRCQEGPTPVFRLLNSGLSTPEGKCLRGIAWLLKMNLLAVRYNADGAAGLE
ncbi:glycosyltransferase family 4 protein [Sphingomonas sp. Leaf25]|uniref:glycosyltransferase family 4 protein n=1 Tax=Sphingomonas sp. Leaf25 TaxID=1735692 RepID=UPI000700C627|nr:glycosyltransferase family 4 protein [Sphingomonas sp. Leaf25]